MREAQDYRCAVCRKHEDEVAARPEARVRKNGRVPFRYPLAVDQCHRTGQVRALLCQPCNRGLGHLRDCPDLVAKALAYLHRHALDMPPTLF